MNVTKQGEGLVSVVKVQIAQPDYEEKVNDVLKDYRKKATVKGFRPGTVYGMVKQMYGKYLLVDEYKNLCHKHYKITKRKLNSYIGEPLQMQNRKM